VNFTQSIESSPSNLSAFVALTTCPKLVCWLSEAESLRRQSGIPGSNGEVSIGEGLCDMITRLDLAVYIEILSSTDASCIYLSASQAAMSNHELLEAGQQLIKERKALAALEAFKLGIHSKKHCSESWFHLASCYESMGEASRSIPSYLKALHLGLPSYSLQAQALLFLGRALIKAGHSKEAQTYLRQVTVKDLPTPKLERLFLQLTNTSDPIAPKKCTVSVNTRPLASKNHSVQPSA
jgi:tetratricopeptide (TPR) repeat protein